MKEIGFSTGVFYPHTSLKDSLKILRNAGIKAVEIGPDYSAPEIYASNQLTVQDLDGFTYVSHHTPKILGYGKNEETEIVFSQIKKLRKIAKLERVVVHPDIVEDFSVFDNVPFKVAFENMDWRKSTFKTPEEMRGLLEKDEDWEMTFDINHVFTKNKSLDSVQDFFQCCKSRISEIHLSGFSKLHDPLFKTRQVEVIKAIKDLDAQIIAESQLQINELQEELDYIRSVLNTT